MATPLIGEEVRQIDKSRGGLINHWVGVLIHINIQTLYNLQYLTINISGYMNAPKEPDPLALKQGREFIMNHPHERIIYSGNKYTTLMKSPTNVSSKQGIHKSTEICNTPTSSIHIVMNILPEIYLKDYYLNGNLI